VGRIGWHDAPICGLFWIKEKGCLVSLGFDNMVKFWTLEEGNKPQMEVTLPLKTHTASMDYPYLLIGSADSTVYIVNLKNLPNAKFPRNP
jgi:WD40 repeat protein